MATTGEKKRINGIVLGAAVFVAYLFIASAPVGNEIALVPAWHRPLDGAESAEAVRAPAEGAPLIAYRLGSQAAGKANAFGYFDRDGNFSVARRTEARFSISEEAWAEYGARPRVLGIRDPRGGTKASVEADGYPFLDDGRIFVVSPEQNSVAAFDGDGKPAWTRDFPAPITTADASAGMFLAGMLDGAIELVDASGDRLFAFEPGGSRIPLIVAARLSEDGKRIALICGLDEQRFLLLEKTNGSFKVAHHESLGEGFRRPAIADFTRDGRWVLYERQEGLGVYDLKNRKGAVVRLEGGLAAIETDADGGRVFAATYGGPSGRLLVGIDLPDLVFLQAPYSGSTSFIARDGDRIFVGVADSLSALDIVGR